MPAAPRASKTRPPLRGLARRATATVALAAATVSAVLVLSGAAGRAAEPADGATVAVAPLVAAWPTSFTVTATKSEPGYIEHLTLTRDADAFALRIELEAQGTHGGGTSLAVVHVADDGTLAWTDGCAVDDCDHADDLRGFLSTAVLVSAEREGRLPDRATLRTLGDHRVVCLTDAQLHPADTAILDLQPCFSVATGAVLGHWSDAAGGFVGATMSATSIVESDAPDLELLTIRSS
ncbi:hypothetical protein RN607_04060 [Demequina capsici]|uniref:Uncharacterized protein n=1 Tax=Demequina capsici TaxID=3075620 RepID=A0AA96JB94_9MICO|nr:hypothetical protein [Demequina sp. PMTSA13]WNM28185.1 hypothetical protein RN607_04060 [Demequina sp. PMTSA13]